MVGLQSSSQASPCGGKGDKVCPVGGCSKQVPKYGDQQWEVGRFQGYQSEFRLHTGESKPLFLHCCPWWLMKQSGVAEVLDFAFWAEKESLGVFYNSKNTPVILRDAFKVFDGGKASGQDEWMRNEERKRETSRT